MFQRKKKLRNSGERSFLHGYTVVIVKFSFIGTITRVHGKKSYNPKLIDTQVQYVLYVL